MHIRILSACLLALLALGGALRAELLGKDRIFVRVTNTRPDKAKVIVRLNIVPNTDQPFTWVGKYFFIGKDGEGEKPEAPRFLAPGESSPWVDVGQYMTKMGTRSYATYLSTLLFGVQTEPAADGLYLLVEVATGRGNGVLRSVAVRKPELPARPTAHLYPWLLGYGTWNVYPPVLPTLGLLVPTQPDINPRVYTLEEALQDQLTVIEKFPDTGRLPGQIVFKTSDHPEVMRALGYNGYPSGTVEGNLGDEIGLEVAMKEEEQNRRFRDYLKGKKISPLDVMSDENAAKAKDLPADKQWELVTLLPPLPAKPVQFYEAANFRYQLWYDELAAKTKTIEAENPGKKVLCGANYSPHMNVWPDVRQWVDPFKAGAMSMSWTEDWWWQLPEVSPQVYGFLLDGLRLAGSYRGAPMQFYIMPFKGNSPDNIRRMHGLAFSHGAKIINHFVTQNQSMITWDYVDQSESPRTYQVIHDMIRDAGAVEDRLYPAQPQKAQVAILLSRAADTWDTEDLGGAGHLYGAKYNVNNDERKSLWMALRHAQYPVDLITDEDVAEGRLAGYKVLYVVGSEMLAAAVKPLAQWVKDGGILFADGGGGLLDEYHRDNKELLALYGLKSHALNRDTRSIRPRRSLPAMTPLDTVTTAADDPALANLQYPALCYRDALEAAADAKVLATYKTDNTPALTYRAAGKGGVYYSGALLGLAYITPAMAEMTDGLPKAFPAALRALATLPAARAKLTLPATTSDPLVEAQYMAGPGGALVLLTNWNLLPVDKVVVRFPGMPVKTVQSLRAAGYFTGSLHDQPLGQLPVQVVDGVPQVELRLELTDYLLVN